MFKRQKIMNHDVTKTKVLLSHCLVGFEEKIKEVSIKWEICGIFWF